MGKTKKTSDIYNVGVSVGKVVNWLVVSLVKKAGIKIMQIKNAGYISIILSSNLSMS